MPVNTNTNANTSITINPWVRSPELWKARNRGDNYCSDLECYTNGALVLTILNGNVPVSDEVIKELYNMNTLISCIDAQGNATLTRILDNEDILTQARFIEYKLETVVYHAMFWEGCEHPLFMAYGGLKDNGICNCVITSEAAKIPVYYIDGDEIILEMVEIESKGGVLYPTRIFPDLKPRRTYDTESHGEPYIEYDGVGYRFTKAYSDKFFPEEYEVVEVDDVVGVVKENSEGERFRVMSNKVLVSEELEEYRHWRWNEGTREECLKIGMSTLAKGTQYFDFDRKIIRNLRDGKSLTISYINDEGHGEIREVDDYPEIQKLIDKVEQEYNVVIYHCIDWEDSEFPVFLGYSAGWSGYNITSESSYGRKGYLDKIEYQAFYFDGKEFGHDHMTVHVRDGALFLVDIFPDFYPEVKPTPKNEHRLPGRYKDWFPYETEHFKVERGKLTYKPDFKNY